MNIRSMCTNVDTMLGFVSNISSEQVAIGISETWFASETDTNIHFIPGYDLISNNRGKKRWRCCNLHSFSVRLSIVS